MATSNSLLSYGILLWGNSSCSVLAFKAQKRTIRMIFKKPPRHSCRELFRTARILPLPCLYIYEAAIYGYKNRDSWTTGSQLHNYGTRSQYVYRLEVHRTAFYESCPEYSCKKIMNSLPPTISDSPSLDIFKSKLKEWLLLHCFYKVSDLYSAA